MIVAFFLCCDNIILCFADNGSSTGGGALAAAATDCPDLSADEVPDTGRLAASRRLPLAAYGDITLLLTLSGGLYVDIAVERKPSSDWSSL